MKIAVVSHDSFWPLQGGGGIRVFWVVKQLYEAGHDITVIAPFLAEGFERQFPNIKVINLGAFSRFMKNKEIQYLKMGYNIFKALFRLDIDIIYAHNIVSAFPSFLASRIKCVPLVYDIDDITMGLSSNKFIKNVGPQIEFFIARASEQTIAMSYSFKRILGLRNVKNIAVVPHGVDIKRFNPGLYRHAEKKNLAIYMGGIENHDGTLLVPLAAVSVLKKIPHMKFLFIGRGGALPKLKSLVKRLGLERSFIFLDWVDHNQLPGYLAQAKIGLITHYYSQACDVALVLKGLEYMSMEVPPVAPNLHGMIEEIGADNERGQLFMCGSPAALSEAIITLMRDEQTRQNKGKAGRKFILNYFRWEENAKKIVKICENCLVQYRK